MRIVFIQSTENSESSGENREGAGGGATYELKGIEANEIQWNGAQHVNCAQQSLAVTPGNIILGAALAR